LRLTRILTRTSGLVAAVLAVLAAVGCGYGGHGTVVQTTGNYSNATLNGTYVYEVHGDSAIGIYREVGAFTADGAGNITAGSDDSNLAGTISFTGTYQVFNDGTGSITFNNSGLGSINFAITVVSSSKLYLMEGDAFADGAGVAELQTAAAATTTPSGTFVFRLHEFSSVESASKSASEVGALSISGGNVNGDRVDQNLGGTSALFSLTGGAFSAPAGMGRGTATITGSSGFSRNLIYYVVDSTKLILLVSDLNAIGSGEAEVQSGAVGNGLSGNYAFGSRGDDPTPGPITSLSATVGNLSASSGTISSYNFDAMQDGVYSNGNTTGTYTTSADGRTALTLSGLSPEVFWMVSPSRAFFLISSGSDVEDGTVDLQTVNSFSASTMKGQYAMVMDGLEFNQSSQTGVLDLARTGALNFDGSGNLTLAELANLAGNSAQPPQGGGLTGNYQIDATGRIVGSLNNSGGTPLNLVMYAVSGSDAYVLQPDQALGIQTSGTVSLQH
jgi:hypothetical protein